MIFNKPKNIKFKFIMVVIYLSFNFSFSQTDVESPKSDFWERVRFGGGIGLSSGTDFFTFGISPSAIYDFNDQFSFGTSLNYTSNKFKNRYKSNIYNKEMVDILIDSL